MSRGKPHVNLVVVGHVDCGKSTLCGRFIFELGGLNNRDVAKLKLIAQELGKESFMFAFMMDRNRNERARGVSIECGYREFYTVEYHYTMIDAPGLRYDNLSFCT